jgi:hypothetical protein
MSEVADRLEKMELDEGEDGDGDVLKGSKITGISRRLRSKDVVNEETKAKEKEEEENEDYLRGSSP